MIGGEAAATQFSGKSSSVSTARPEVPERDFQESEGELAANRSFSDMPWPKVSVIIPTLNEARNLPHVFSALPPALHEVIIVDGHSVERHGRYRPPTASRCADCQAESQW